jgi:hypothetical protein
VIQLTSGPLSLRDVGTPLLPVLGSLAVLLQTLLLLTEDLCVVNVDHGDAVCPVCNVWTMSRRAGWLVMVVKVKSGKERQVVRINYDGKSDGCEVKERNNARQPNRDKFQELDATGSGQEEKRDSSSSYDTLQIYGPCWKVHWGTRETQPLPSSPQQVGSASQQFTAYRLFLSIGPRCSTVRQARRSPRGTFQFQNIDIQPSFVSQWKCQCPCRSETAVESPDQSPPGLFQPSLETPLGSTHALFNPDCQFTETFLSPPPTFCSWNKRHI